MSDLTRNLVDAIISGKATAIEDSFQAAMSDKISSAMEARKVVLAQGLFRESIEEELTLEDYSIDELEDYMMSEEFEQLDEVSKKTLGSYVTKAHDQLMAHTAAVNMKTGRGDKDAFAYSHDTDTMRKEKNRKKGLSQAVGKLTKEEVELDEVSQGTLDSYRKKSFDEPGEKREAGRKLAFAKSAGTSGDAKVSSTEEVTKAKSQIKDIIKPEHHAKYPISKITGFTAARKIYKQASAAGHLKEEVESEELDD